MSDGGGGDVARIRASDAEREHVAGIVRRAVVDGRLTMVEGDERLRDTYAAVHRDDLAPLTADLAPLDPPAPGPRSGEGGSSPAVSTIGPGAASRRATSATVAVMSGPRRRGEWTPGRTHVVTAVMGGADLAFGEARLDPTGLTLPVLALMGGVELDLRGIPAGGGEVVVRAVAIMGGVTVSVDPDTTVHAGGFGLMGGFDDGAGPPRRPDGPVVRVHGVALMGGIEVRRRPLALTPADEA